MLRLKIILFGIVIAGTANAADISLESNSGETAHRVSLFSGTDFSSLGSYVGFAGATLAPFGSLEKSGMRVGLFQAAGVYRYNTMLPDPVTGNDSPLTVKGKFISSDLLLGYGHVGENWNAKLYLGLNVQNQHIAPLDLGNPVVGTKAGVRVQGDVWISPTKETMLFALASYSTAFRTYYTNAKFGYDVSNGRGIFFGPEFVAQGNERYDQLRFGAHITGIKFNNALELGLSVGYVRETDAGLGIYGNVVLSRHF